MSGTICKAFRAVWLLLALTLVVSCGVPLIYVPTEGPESKGVTQRTKVEALIGNGSIEVQRQLGEPQWSYRSDGRMYLIYHGWHQHGLWVHTAGTHWNEKSYCWLLEFGPEDILQHIDRETSVEDCREVFWTEDQLISLQPGDANTKWQLYAEADEPGPQEWRWLCQAADEGHLLARHRLGTIYYYGLDGAQSDLTLAYVWYSLAESTGSEARQLEWVRESLSADHLSDAQRLVATWEPGRCESELLAKIESTQ